jgi:hypothetical protein
MAVAFTNHGTEPDNTDYTVSDVDYDLQTQTNVRALVPPNTRGVLIKTDRTNHIALSPKWINVSARPMTTTGGNALVADSAIKDLGYYGYEVPNTAAAIYPGLYLENIAPLVAAGFGAGELSSNAPGWVVSAQSGIRAINTSAWKTGSTDATKTTSVTTTLTHLEAIGASSDDYTAINTATPRKFKFAGYENPDTGITLNSVANTYGKLYAHMSINPFGQTLKGSTWHIQPGLNYMDFENNFVTETASKIDGGARVLRFGGAGDPESNNCFLPVNPNLPVVAPPVIPEGTTTAIEVDFNG